MPNPPSILVVLPAYNEAPNIEPLLERWETVFAADPGSHRYVIVDDGSTDGMPSLLREAAARLPLDIVVHEKNQGLGATLRDGLVEAVRQADDDDLIVTMDADNTHPPEIFPDMRRRILADPASNVVIASRFVPGARVIGLGVFRRFTSTAARLVFRVLLPIKGVRDYTCGYRLYRASLLREALAHYGDQLVTEPGFACMAEVLIKLGRRGARFAEVPLLLRYDAKGGDSKMNVGQTIGRTLRMIARLRRKT